MTLGLVVGEGLETCLAAARAGLIPVWSTLTAGNLAAFPVLPGLAGLTSWSTTIAQPKDRQASGIEAARAVVSRYAEDGFDPDRDIQVIMLPTEGRTPQTWRWSLEHLQGLHHERRCVH